MSKKSLADACFEHDVHVSIAWVFTSLGRISGWEEDSGHSGNEKGEKGYFR